MRKHFPEYICPMYSGKHSPEEPPPESTLAGLFRYFRAARRARIDSRTTSAGRHATRTRIDHKDRGLISFSFASTQGTASRRRPGGFGRPACRVARTRGCRRDSAGAHPTGCRSRRAWATRCRRRYAEGSTCLSWRSPGWAASPTRGRWPPAASRAALPRRGPRRTRRAQDIGGNQGAQLGAITRDLRWGHDRRERRLKAAAADAGPIYSSLFSRVTTVS